jgi:hypothetical protein
VRSRKTVLNVKIRAGRQAYEMWSLLKITAFFIGIPLAVIGALQVHHCREISSGKTIWECLTPGIEVDRATKKARKDSGRN